MIRLTEAEKKGILNAVEKVATALTLQWQEISVFGSRADGQKKGGDIDLYIKFHSAQKFDLYSIKQKLRIELENQLGEQKIDVVLDDGQTDLGEFGKIVLNQKKTLWKNN